MIPSIYLDSTKRAIEAMRAAAQLAVGAGLLDYAQLERGE